MRQSVRLWTAALASASVQNDACAAVLSRRFSARSHCGTSNVPATLAGSSLVRFEHGEARTDRRCAGRLEARGAEQRCVLVLGAFAPAEHDEHLQIEPGCGRIGEVALAAATCNACDTW